MSEADYSERHQLTMAEIVARARPIGDLSRFVIEDLTEDDEAEFFEILSNA